MPRAVRIVDPDLLYFATTRTHQERFFLDPHTVRPLLRRRRRRRAKRGLGGGGGAKASRSRRPSLRIARPPRCRDPKRHLRELLERIDSGLPISAASYEECVYNLIGAWLAKAQDRHHIRIYAVIAMYNHLQLLLQLEDSAEQSGVSDFMEYFLGRLTQAVNRAVGRTHQLFGRRFDIAPCLDERAAADKFAYTICNPCDANLVERAEQWPSVNSWEATKVGESELVFVHLDRTAWHAAGRPDDLLPFLSKVQLVISPLPAEEHMTAEERCAHHRELIAAREASCAEARQADGKAALGRARLRDSHPFWRPADPKRSPRPLCHSFEPALDKAYREHVREVTSQFRLASWRYLQGDRSALFPPQTCIPRCWHPATRVQAA